MTGLIYVAGIDSPSNSGRGPKGYFPHDLTTGSCVAADFRGLRTGGLVVTAGGVVFVGAGSNIAVHLRMTRNRRATEIQHRCRSIFVASIYMVNGEEFVTSCIWRGERGRRGGDLILSFAPPKP
jgi:hypothetical protein